jgi:flagellar hook-associated protein 2
MSSTSALDSLLNSASDTSSNGIDISSILSAITGNTEAIDVDSAVSAAIYADRAPERVWQNDQTTLSNETSALTSIEQATTAVSNDLQSLNSLTGPLSERTVTSSSSNVTATAASGTVAGNHTVVVNNLATTGSWYSSVVSSSTATLPTSSFTITTGSGSKTISTGSGTTGDTLNDLVTAINGDNLGVTASVVTDSTGSRLAIIANASGAAASFSITAGTGGLSFTQAVAGQDASLTVDGIPIDSASNTVSGAIPGVTLTLLGASSTPADLTVASNTSDIANALNQFVSDYNSAVGLVNAQYTVNSSGNEGVLAPDSTISSLQSTLGDLLNYAGTPTSGTTSTVNTLSDLGITENSDGTLSLDTSTLEGALTNNPNDVQNFLLGSALNGFAGSAVNALNTFTDPTNGAFTLDLNGINNQNTDLTNEINNFETNYIANQQTALTAEFSTAEAALQQMPSQLQAIQAELGNNSNSNGNG